MSDWILFMALVICFSSSAALSYSLFLAVSFFYLSANSFFMASASFSLASAKLIPSIAV